VLSDGEGNIGLYIDDNGILRFAGDNTIPKLATLDQVTVADDGTLTVLSGQAGACIVHVYDTGSGAGAIFFASYGGSTAIIESNGSVGFSTSDTDGSYCLFKNPSSHTVTFKNRSGSSRNMRLFIVGSAV